MKLVEVSYEQCRLEFFEEQLAAAKRKLDWAVKHNPDCYAVAEKGEAVAFFEWAAEMAEIVLQAKDDREKLIKLLCEAEGAATDAALFDFGTFREQLEVEADYLLAHGVRLKTKQATSDESKRWIPVTERLPEENEYVLIWCGSTQVARIVKGISEEERAAMKRGELPDPEEYCWCLSDGWTAHKRSSIYGFGDVHGNNKVPYAWKPNGGPMQWFGQDVTHWMPLPEPPKEDKLW